MTPESAPIQSYDSQHNRIRYQDPQDSLPADDGLSAAFGKNPCDPSTFIADRLVYTNQKRRNLQNADWFRGDLPIVPDNRDWFQVSVKPHLDLRKGYIQVENELQSGEIPTRLVRYE